MSRLTTVNSNYFETSNLNGTVVTINNSLSIQNYSKQSIMQYKVPYIFIYLALFNITKILRLLNELN